MPHPSLAARAATLLFALALPPSAGALNATLPGPFWKLTVRVTVVEPPVAS